MHRSSRSSEPRSIFSDKGDVSRFLEISDPDVTYFDPFLPAPLHGLKALKEYYSRIGDSAPLVRGEMTNAKVQVAGDAAVLTFNYIQDGLEHSWNTTEVYRRTPGGWRIIHTHWAFRKAEVAA